ncbi:Nn.00g078960.m01.CDS01 [Neocucurbitaria sp. VM-36]
MTSSSNGWFPSGVDDGHDKYWAEHGHPELLVPQNFSKSSRNIWLKEDHILVADCCTVNGEYVTATLDLNKVLGNDNGKFAPGEGFLESCQRPVKLKDEGRTLHTKLSDFSSMHSGVHASLDRFIGNANGKLVCAYWDEDRCPRGESGQPEMIFECNKGDGSGVVKEHFVMYQVSGETSQTYQFRPCFLAYSHHLSTGSTSEECVSLVQRWIEECEQNHERCAHERQLRSEGTSSSKLPSRVLDIGDRKNDPIRLIETKGSSARYVCLSHCWGKCQTLTLTKANAASLQNNVPINSLQSVYRDAIQFCRRLGVRYIWIDALCIVQDDANDWAIEAAKMASYYGQCYICLAATSAADHDGSCSTSTPRWKFAGKGIDGLPYIVYVRPNTVHIADGKHEELFPLLTRAWVYQERRLSTRVLHFCQSEVFFECTSMGVCECNRKPKKMQSLFWTKNRETYAGGHHLLSDTEYVKDEKAHLKQEWHAFVTAYTTLKLTCTKDRLPALAGLARLTRKRREAAQVSTGRYLAGLWEEQFASDMAWSVGKSVSRYQKEGNKSVLLPFDESRNAPKASLPRPEEYIAPSWSWANVLDVVNFAPFEYTQTLCRILQAEVDLVGSDEYGQIRGGSLIIQGRLLQSTYAYINSKHRLRDVTGTRTHILPTRDEGMVFWPDYDIQAEGRGKVDGAEPLHIMPLVSRPVLGRSADAEFRWRFYPGSTKVETVYLVLRRVVSEKVPVFERIGWSEYTGSNKVPDLRQARDMKFMLV